MGWKVNLTVSQQRREFITEYQRGEESLTALCRHYQICRATGYKWITRFEQEGPAGQDQDAEDGGANVHGITSRGYRVGSSISHRYEKRFTFAPQENRSGEARRILQGGCRGTWQRAREGSAAPAP